MSAVDLSEWLLHTQVTGLRGRLRRQRTSTGKSAQRLRRHPALVRSLRSEDRWTAASGTVSGRSPYSARSIDYRKLNKIRLITPDLGSEAKAASDSAHTGRRSQIPKLRGSFAKVRCRSCIGCHLPASWLLAQSSAAESSRRPVPFRRPSCTTYQPSRKPTGRAGSQPSACERKPTSAKPVSLPSAASATRLTSGKLPGVSPASIGSSSLACSAAVVSGQSASRRRAN